jgi:DNA-binding CsgD family transcriptional regulator
MMRDARRAQAITTTAMATISKVAICASRLSIEDRREAVKNLTDEGLGLREVGDILGVSHQTVANDVKDLTEKIH